MDDDVGANSTGDDIAFACALDGTMELIAKGYAVGTLVEDVGSMSVIWSCWTNTLLR